MVTISDTSPIVNLIEIEKLTLLKSVFGEIYVPPTVHTEVLALERFGVDLADYRSADWIHIVNPQNQQFVSSLRLKLDVGEAEAIALALEHVSGYLIIDERKGTLWAKSYGIQTIGLLGVLVKAKQMGCIEQVKPLILALETKAGFWIGEKLKQRVLAQVGEVDG